MNLSVVGLGYVGSVCSAIFAELAHNVIGVDVDENKVNLINSGKSPIVEKDLDEYIKRNVKRNRLKATTDLKYAVKNSDITIISVGTPSKISGDIDLSYIKEAAREIGEVLKEKNSFHIVSMRSTVLPGTAKNVVIPIIEKYSNKKVGVDFGYISNPEFLRESTAIWDFLNPPKTVIGYSDEKSRDIFIDLYKFTDAPLFTTEIEVAEMIKYADNSWHAVKVTFANEIGMICKKLNIDSHKVMDIFCADRKLNISPYYLKPGFAFGGSCLPKDVKALIHKAKELDEDTKLLNSLMDSNEYQIRRVFNFIRELESKKISFLGITFKPNTNDLRESPMLELVERLIGKGYEVEIFDEDLEKVIEKGGSDKRILETDLHHIYKRLNKNLEEVIRKSDIIVIGNNKDKFKIVDNFKDKYIVDLVRLFNRKSSKNYIGVGW